MEMDLAPCLEGLTHAERIYVQSRLQGMSQRASAAAAGYLERDCSRLEHRPKVQEAMRAAHEIGAKAVGFSILQAHQMLMDAYTNADKASEQVQAVLALMKLHGVEAPKKVEHVHTHRLESDEDARRLTDEQLEQLAALPHGLTLDGTFEVIRTDADGAKDGAELMEDTESLGH